MVYPNTFLCLWTWKSLHSSQTMLGFTLSRQLSTVKDLHFRLSSKNRGVDIGYIGVKSKLEKQQQQQKHQKTQQVSPI